MAQLSVFGKEVKKRLIDIEHTQTWLVEQVKERTGLYIDDSYLYKIKTGKLSTPKVIEAICEILDIKYDPPSDCERRQHEHSTSI